MMFGQLFRKINLMNLVTIFTQLTAGIFGTCNHVTSMLFRIKNAVETVLTTTK